MNHPGKLVAAVAFLLLAGASATVSETSLATSRQQWQCFASPIGDGGFGLWAGNITVDRTLSQLSAESRCQQVTGRICRSIRCQMLGSGS